MEATYFVFMTLRLKPTVFGTTFDRKLEFKTENLIKYLVQNKIPKRFLCCLLVEVPWQINENLKPVPLLRGRAVWRTTTEACVTLFWATLRQGRECEQNWLYIYKKTSPKLQVCWKCLFQNCLVSGSAFPY